MSNIKVIPAGYKIIVHSYENDGDHQRVESISGLTHTDTENLVSLIKLLWSRYSPQAIGCATFGNLYEPDDSEVKAFKKAVTTVIKNFKDHGKLDIRDFGDAEHYYSELGLMWCGEFYTRVVEDLEIEYYPSPVEIQDVTDEF